MMTLLAGALQWLVGVPKLLSTGALLAIVILAHNWWLERDARLRDQGAQTCEAEHQLALVKAQRDVAERATLRAKAEAAQERQIAEDIRHERKTIGDEFEAYKLAASSDPRCLSDGVLDLLRGDGGLGKKR
jgi:hypothetical protein